MQSELEGPIPAMAKAYAAAVYAKDVEAFMALYDADVRIFDLWMAGTHRGAAAWRQAVTEWFGSLGTERVGVEIEILQAFVEGNLAAGSAWIIYRNFSAEGKEQRSMRNRLTWTLRRSDDAWRVVTEHTSAPIDFQTMKPILKVK